MHSTSFNDVVDRAKHLLETDKEFNGFCVARWGKKPGVNIFFRSRKEISFAELPIILITRPQVTDRSRVRHGREGRHILRLYAGFHQNDRSIGMSELIWFEEMIEDALTRNNPFSDLVLEVAVRDSVNDEGVQYPAYFLAMHVEFLYQRKA